MDISSLAYTTKTTRDFPLNNKLIVAARTLGDIADWLYVGSPPFNPHAPQQHLHCWEPRGDQLKPFLIRFRCQDYEIRLHTPETIITPYSAHSQIRWGRKWLPLHPSGVMFDSISLAPVGRPCFLEKIIITNKEPNPVEIEIVAGGSYLRPQDEDFADGNVSAEYEDGTMMIASTVLEFRPSNSDEWLSQQVAYSTDCRAPGDLRHYIAKHTIVIRPEQTYSFVVGEWLDSPDRDQEATAELLNEAMAQFDALMDATKASWTEALRQAPSLECPDPDVENMWNWAWVNLELLDRTSPNCAWLPHVEYTSLSHLPTVYGWDHLYTTMVQMFFQPEWAKQVLREFLRRQWDDGYIDAAIHPNGRPGHLMLQTHAIFALALWNYVQTTGDPEFLNESVNEKTVYQRVKLAFDWYEKGGKYITCFHHGEVMDHHEIRETQFLREDTGLVWGPGLGDHGADTALYRKWDNEWVDMNAFLYQGVRAMEGMTQLMGDDGLSRHYADWAEKIKNSINTLMWDPEKRFYFDLDHDQSRLDAVTIGGLSVLHDDITDEERSQGVIDTLCDPTHFDRPYGIPNVSVSHPDYNPRQYFWFGLTPPHYFFNCVVALYRRGKSELAHSLFRKFMNAYAKWDGGPRYFYEAWNPDNGEGQWSGNYNWTSMAVLPVVLGMAGFRVGLENAELNPALPQGWSFLRIKGVALKGSVYDIVIEDGRAELIEVGRRS